MKSSGGLTGSLDNVTSGLGAMLGPAALAATAVAVLGAGLKQVISTGMDFTKVMSNVKALTGANADEFKRLNDAAISLGASTTFSSSQVADAMVVAAQAGQDVNQIIASMPGYLDLAASSQLGLADSVQIGLSTMQQFGLKAGDMGRIVDQLTYTSVKSATGLDDLGEGLKYMGVASASLKVPLSETLATLGVFADAGERGSVGARTMSSAIQRLAAPTKKMQEVMDNLNLSFFDSNGKFIGINNSVELLEQRMKGFTDEQKANTLSLLFGNEAFSEWTILMNKGSKELKSLTAEIENSNGTAAKIARTQLDNLSGDIEQFSGSWESLQLKIFSQGESGFRGLVQMATTFLTRLGNAWADITEPLSEVASLFGEVWDAVKELLDTVGLLGGEFDLLSVYFKALKWHLELITGGLRYALKFWIWLFHTIRDGVIVIQSFWDALKNLASNITKVFVPVGEILQGVFTLDWTKIKSGYSGLKSGLSSVLGDAGKTLNESFAARMNKRSSTDKSNQEDMSPLLGDVAKTNQSLVPNAGMNGSTKINSGIDVVGNEKGSGKSVVVTINNLINTLTVTGANLQQNVKQAVLEALTDGIRDFETSYG